MLKARFPKLRSFLMFVAIVAAAWAVQKWTYSDEIIRIVGKLVKVIDGDSFKAGDEEFRIYGIDAPEYQQNCKDEKGRSWSCGKTARTELDAILRHDDFSCSVKARDRFGRVVVICTTDKGTDLGSVLVERGLAASGHNFDETIYAVDERAAKKSKRGIWRGEFKRPDIWRAENPRS